MQRRKKISKIIIGIILIAIGVIVGIIPFYLSNTYKKLEEEKIEDFFKEEIVEVTPIKTEVSEEPKKNDFTIDYFMVLEIPKIGLKKGVPHIDSKYNKISYGIQIMKESTMPDNDMSMVVFASHRGTSSVSYFNKLGQVSNGDEVYLYYNGYKYTYSISDIYEEEKDGTIAIHKDIDKSIIALITCKKNDQRKQLVFIGNMVNKERY